MARFKKCLVVLTLATCLISLSACGGSGGGSSADDEKNPTIGVLFPDNKTPLWENEMWPSVRDNIKKECPDCKVKFANVSQDAAEQRNQADSMISQGVKALLLAPVDATSSKVIVDSAKAKNIPVVGFASIGEGPVAAFIGVDVKAIGKAQGEAFLAALQKGGDPKRGCVVALDGDAKTPAVKLFLDGRNSVIDGKVDICKETNIENWDPSTAQTVMDQAITAIGKDKIIGVYGMNDGIAGGAVAAMKSAGFKEPFPPVGGQDSDLAAVQRILVGLQAYTINNQVGRWGETAAPVVLAAARGEKLKSDSSEKNSTVSFPWFKTPEPVAVTKDNIQAQMIDSGKYKYDEICTPDYKAACDAAGLKPAA